MYCKDSNLSILSLFEFMCFTICHQQTIIEALKYAVTNSFPPNCNKGSSFVNDPKLTNGCDVRL